MYAYFTDSQQSLLPFFRMLLSQPRTLNCPHYQINLWTLLSQGGMLDRCIKLCCGIDRHCFRAQWGVYIFGIPFLQTTTGASFHTDIHQWSVSLPENWVSTAKCDEQCLRISKLENLPLSTSPPVHILLTVTISIDGDWSVHACGKQVTPHNCKILVASI